MIKISGVLILYQVKSKSKIKTLYTSKINVISQRCILHTTVFLRCPVVPFIITIILHLFKAVFSSQTRAP